MPDCSILSGQNLHADFNQNRVDSIKVGYLSPYKQFSYSIEAKKLDQIQHHGVILLINTPLFPICQQVSIQMELFFFKSRRANQSFILNDFQLHRSDLKLVVSTQESGHKFNYELRKIYIF